MIGTAPKTNSFGARDFAVVVIMNILWGFNIIAVKMAVTAIAPLTAGFLRQLIVLVVCGSALRIVPGKMRLLTILGILSGGLFYIVVNVSLAVSDNVGALAIAGQLGVPFSLLLAILVFRERIRWPRIAGIALSFGGVVLLVFDPDAAREVPGLMLTAVASFIWAICSLIQRYLIGVPVLTIYAWVGFWGSVTLGTLAWFVEPAAMRTISSLPLSTLGWVAFSAIGSTVIGQGSMSWLLQRHPISVVTPLTLAAPIVSVFAASWYFGTPLTMLMLTGGAVAMLGVAIVTIRTARAGDTP
ncbi:DMT family transporter [Sphingomonas sp. So64.6b]|uniref:DMT family transporter n=1 Tax=Sphingomonas sp. So64.6b TaxID=2997354 RepID=UPI00160430D2|nr:DMT family transporter [Sphingomonas sp. So64.6b]QNA84055.1 DMT family transporter [Sphingomonas sp. So64.6b]